MRAYPALQWRRLSWFYRGQALTAADLADELAAADGHDFLATCDGPAFKVDANHIHGLGLHEVGAAIVRLENNELASAPGWMAPLRENRPKRLAA